MNQNPNVLNLEAKPVKPDHADFIALVQELNLALTKITNDSGASSFSAEAFDETRDGCVVIYADTVPVSCGLFRYHAKEVCELKRMYSKLPGSGSFLLKTLERYAMSKGYQQALLSTRRINTKAVNFYKKHSYTVAKPYGKYVKASQSICFTKYLLDS